MPKFVGGINDPPVITDRYSLGGDGGRAEIADIFEMDVGVDNINLISACSDEDS